MIPFKQHWLGIALALLALACFSQEAAAKKVGPEFRLSNPSVVTFGLPSVGQLADGGFVAAWRSNGTVVARRYDADGEPRGREFAVGTGDVEHPGVVGLKNGGFVIVWNPDFNLVQGQLFDAAGARVGGTFQIAARSRWRQSVAGLEDGGFVVVWSNRITALGQRFNRFGRRAGSVFRIDTEQLNGGGAVAAGLSGGGFVVVWDWFPRDEAATNGISGQRYDEKAKPVGGKFKINTSPNFAYQPQIAALPKGRFVVVWTSRLYIQGRPSEDIHGQRFSATGTRLGGEFRVNTYTKSTQWYPSAAGLKGGGFVVTWSSNQNSSPSNIYSQRYDAKGAPASPEVAVNDRVGGAPQEFSVVAETNNGGFVIVWRSDGGRHGIFGQRFLPRTE